VERIPEYVYLDVETRQEIDRLAGTALASVDVVDRDTSWTAAALKATPSRRRFLALTDAVGERRTQNQPGTVDEYSNWRAPLSGPDGRPMCLEDIYTSDRAAVLAERMRES
jgi:4-alpha-glucanotransferase